ncbi:MAG TPA: hypothetical protein PLA02_03000 [Brevefilum fermentans]|jgi:hypothetical protein|nr:hypothetical protein [Brevefilum fermentans]HPX96460.1 hypothetical protein [Brevefilum fermentans]HQA28171.1 hypothetical protein [Brevefilum fermentans]
MLKNHLKHTRKIVFSIVLIACVVVGLISARYLQVDAYSLGSKSPDRQAVITVSYTTYEWWLLTWNNSKLICTMYIEHEGWPHPDEVKYFCGDQISKDWQETNPCIFSEDIESAAQCPGLYLHLVSVTPGEREIEVTLLPPEVFIDIADCDPQPPENRCETQPRLHLIAVEPLPNEQIISIQGTIGNDYFSCQGSECTVPLPATGINGVRVTFWADSSFGDSTELFTAQIRVIPWGDFAAPDVNTVDTPYWYVDILSSQYLRDIGSSCSQIWSAFPPVGGPPLWLSSPDHPDALISSEPYYYLAGSLIREGLAGASECPGGGLQPSGVANQCGLDATRELMNDWQNQFNAEIVRVSKETGIPGQLMKNIFSRESQFWPGFAASHYEAGLGHLSDMGADTVLLWNPEFFRQFCPLVLDTTVCQQGFGNLDIGEQEMLRGALVNKVNAACPECPMGIDLQQANFSISIFARSLLANCEQVGQIIYNTTRRLAGEVSSYEDLWRFTLINYNGGPGCLSNAIEQTYKSGHPLTWDAVIQHIEPGICRISIDYVNDIAYMPGIPTTTPTPSVSPNIFRPTTTPTPLPQEVVPPFIIQLTPTPTSPYGGGYPPAPTNAYQHSYP